MKKILKLLIITALLTLIMPCSYAVNNSGTCGENLTWDLNDDGLLTIRGTGDMYNWFHPTSNEPWLDYNSKIINVNIQAGVTSIGNQAFYKCESLKQVTIPQGVTSIGYESFFGCKSLTDINIVSTVENISNCAFSSCSAITKVDIPQGVQNIGDLAFTDCSSLRTVSIPASVKRIGSDCFYNCDLETIYYAGTKEQWEQLFYENNNILPGNIEIIYNVTNLTSNEMQGKVTTSFGAVVSEWAAPEIEEAFENNLVPEVMIGYDLTEKVNRGEFAAIAVQLYETLSQNSVAEASDCTFLDITNDINEKAIKKAYRIEIAQGTSKTTYEPLSYINREQLATMLCRVIKKHGDPNWTMANDLNYYMDISDVRKFADDSDISDWAKPSVYFMSKYGIVKGVDDTHFAPKNTTSQQEASGYASATREQAIILAQRIFTQPDIFVDFTN